MYWIISEDRSKIKELASLLYKIDIECCGISEVNDFVVMAKSREPPSFIVTDDTLKGVDLQTSKYWITDFSLKEAVPVWPISWTKYWAKTRIKIREIRDLF
jgi:hypothetical protein